MEATRAVKRRLGWSALALVALWALAACRGRPFAWREERLTSPPTTLFTSTPVPSSPTPPFSPTPTRSPTPTPQPTPTPLTCWTSGGRIETHRLTSAHLAWPLDVRVYLPPCYDAQPTRRYPVLYLIHGQNFTDAQWDRLGVDETLDRLIPQGELPPFIVVMPRDREWTQPAESGFDEALLDDLLPWVEARYRTLPGRRYRAIGGLSRGAAWALHLAFTHWEVFGAVGGHSPPVFWTDGPKVRGWLAAIPPQAWPRIYLDIGEGDRQEILESARWLEGLLTELGIPHEWHLNAGRHDEAYWSAHVEAYLRWYAAPWQVAPDE